MTLVVADILALLGVAGATIAVIGVARSRSVYVQIHASTVAVMAGVMFFLAAALTGGEGAIIGRAILVAGFLLLTTPVSGHAIARLQYFMDGRADGSAGAVQDGGGPQTNGARSG